MRLVTYNPSKDLFLNEFVWFQVNRNSELGTVVSTCSRDFNDLFKCRSKECKEDIQAVNSRQTSRKVTNLLAYKTIYRNLTPTQGRKLSSIRLPRVRIEGQTLHRSAFNSIGPGTKLDINLPPTRAKAKPSSLEVPLLDKRKGKELTGGPSKKSKKKAEDELDLPPFFKRKTKLRKPAFSTIEFGKQVTVVDSAKDRDASLALVQAVILPKDVVDLVEEGLEEICNLLVMQQVQSLQRAIAISERMKEQFAEIKKSKKKISSLERMAKLDSKAVEKAKMELATVVQERDASYVAVTEAQREVSAI
ncbi:hypothetical protein Acr_12g0004340 [Actinidia rufa]|uniref:Uncharacterized protein n=1 Tax=Actinidia rufa TaxID=165716 RepID=A0A7J0FH29_9ERIC|nr:hypothetical protein Acr_12g0004340 [Actinidia rufa]